MTADASIGETIMADAIMANASTDINEMKNIQKREPRFGDDYIPLLLSDEELTRVREQSTSDRA
jgi:hypothetical protein